MRWQLEAGPARIDFVGEDINSVIYSPERAVRESYRAKEIRWLMKHAKDYGYVLVGNSWVKVTP
jgi:hypothetical protein